jgi:hypothetical protein
LDIAGSVRKGDGWPRSWRPARAPCSATSARPSFGASAAAPAAFRGRRERWGRSRARLSPRNGQQAAPRWNHPSPHFDAHTCGLHAPRRHPGEKASAYARRYPPPAFPSPIQRRRPRSRVSEPPDRQSIWGYQQAPKLSRETHTKRARREVSRPSSPPPPSSAGCERSGRSLRGRLPLARTAFDRRARRLAVTSHPLGLRGRPRAGRAPEGARLRRVAFHLAPRRGQLRGRRADHSATASALIGDPLTLWDNKAQNLGAPE